MIRQLADTVKVLSADRIRVNLRGGIEIVSAARLDIPLDLAEEVCYTGKTVPRSV